MQFLKNSWLKLLLLCLVVAGVIYFKNKIASKNLITHGTSENLGALLNVHSSETKWLIVNGTKYNNVTGHPPFYLALPNESYIFFVEIKNQRKSNETRTAHLISTKDTKKFKFEGITNKIGESINRNNSEDFTIIKKMDKILIVTEVVGDFKRRFTFDLDENNYFVREWLGMEDP